MLGRNNHDRTSGWKIPAGPRVGGVDGDLQRRLFDFSCKGETYLHPKMPKAGQQEDQEAEKELDRFAVRLIV